MDQWQDGWTIYVWLVAGAMIILAAIYYIRWAAKNDQFDEDIKYVVFDESDKEKMSEEEYQKSIEVNNSQQEKRKAFLEKNKQ